MGADRRRGRSAYLRWLAATEQSISLASQQRFVSGPKPGERGAVSRRKPVWKDPVVASLQCTFDDPLSAPMRIRVKRITPEAAYRTVAKREVEDLRGYVEGMERMLKREAGVLGKRAQKWMAKMTKEAADDYAEWISEDLDQLQTVFPAIFRFSLFIHCYAVFEHSIVNLAKRLQRERELRLSPSDLRDDGIARACTYLKKVIMIPFPDQSSEWQTIQKLRDVRNAIVHNGGRIATEHPARKRIKALATQWPGAIVLNDENSIILKETFIPRVLDTFDQFADVLVTNFPPRAHE